MQDECKSISEWAKDSRVPFARMTIWRAVKDHRLKASTPVGTRKIVIKWSDMEKFLHGEADGKQA